MYSQADFVTDATTSYLCVAFQTSGIGEPYDIDCFSPEALERAIIVVNAAVGDNILFIKYISRLALDKIADVAMLFGSCLWCAQHDINDPEAKLFPFAERFWPMGADVINKWAQSTGKFTVEIDGDDLVLR